MAAALGFFVAFDHVLHEDLGPLDRLLASPIAGKLLVDAFTNVYWKRTRTQRGAAPGPFDWRRMRPRILRGECVTFGPSNIVRSLQDPDDRRIEMMVDTAPLELVPRLPEHQPRGERPGRCYRYDLSLAVGAQWLESDAETAALIDAMQRFAIEVSAVVGVIVAAATHREAMAVASYTGGERGSPLDRRTNDLWIAHWTWGREAREPEWGTFLTRAHADVIGGIDAIRAAADPYRLVESERLVFVQLSPYADALAPETEGKRLALETLMRPILTARRSSPAEPVASS